VALLPTPGKADGDGGHLNSDGFQSTLPGVARDMALLPSPRTSDTNGAGHHGDGGMDLPKGGPNQRGSSGDLMLPSAVQSLLPTPTAMDSRSSGGNPGHHRNAWHLTDATVRQPARWGEYEPAIRRWESVTRPAPEPTKLNSKGNPKLSDEFDEWLMGYPAGWITEVPGATWNETLKACGNGVVPQQGAAAVRWLLRMGQAVA